MFSAVLDKKKKRNTKKLKLLQMFALIFSLVLILLTAYLTYQYFYSYWKRRHIAYIKPWPLIGNILDLFLLKVSFGELFQSLYEHPNFRNKDYGGIFVLYQPALILRDPALIKKVLIKDFNMFLNRFEAADIKYDTMGYLTLPLAKYTTWRSCRQKMSEIFTTGRIKERMYPLMLDVIADMEYFISRKFENNKHFVVMEVKEMCSLYTTDLTSLLHYGVKANGLKLGHSLLRQQAKELFKTNFKKVVEFFIIFFLPQFTTALRAKVFSTAYSNFMRKFTKDILSKRKQFPVEYSYTKGDLLDVLEMFQKQNTDHKSFARHPDFIPSQVAIFLLAGFETSSSVIAFILYELSKYPEVQNQLRLELQQAFQQKQFLSYENLQELSYLHQVVCEGLRLYPAAAFINRECTPGWESEAGYYLKPDLYIPKGMPVYISILGLQRDPRFWPDPLIFRPQRFSLAESNHINPMTYLPFGAGPHGCIGSRLGLLQVKLGLAHILKSYRVEQCHLTPNKIKFDEKSFMLQNKGGLYLRFIKD